MTFAISIVLLAQLSPAALFARVAQAHARLHDFSVKIEIEAAAGSKRDRREIDLSCRNSSALLRIRQPAHDGNDRSDRSFELNGSMVTGFDSVAFEWLRRSVPSRAAGRAAKLEAALGGIDEAVGFLLDSTRSEMMLNNFKASRGWVVGREGPDLTLSESSGQSQVRLRIDAASGLVRALWMQKPGNALNWQIHYSAARRVALHVPADARFVGSFTELKAPPKFGTQASQRLVQSMLRAEGALTSARVDVAWDQGYSRISFDRRRIREDQGRFSWAFDGHVLSVLDRKRRLVFFGKSTRTYIIDYVTKLGCKVDPLARSLLLRKAPFREFLSPDLRVSVSGNVSLRGTPCSLVRMIGLRRRIALLIRNDNHLVASAATDIVDERGKTLESSSRQFQYFHLGSNVRFDLSIRGATRRSLPPIPHF